MQNDTYFETRKKKTKITLILKQRRITSEDVKYLFSIQPITMDEKNELIMFSVDNVQRSLPSFFDGLKPGN